MYVNKPQEKVQTIIPGRETSSGLTHVYKENGKWCYVPEDEYEARKDKLPGLSLAIRYPYADFESKAILLPDLTDTLQKIGHDEAAASHGDLKSKL